MTDFYTRYGFTGKQGKYAEYGMEFMAGRKAEFAGLTRRQMKRKVISEIKREYGMGPIVSLLLHFILSKIASAIVDFWLRRWSSTTPMV